MNFKTTYVLFGLLLALLAVVGVVLFVGPTKTDASGLLFPSVAKGATKIEAGDVTRIAVRRSPQTEPLFVLARGEDKAWRVESPRPMLADAGSASSLVSNILDARIDPENAPRSRKEAGLDKPTRVITITGKDRELTLTVGDTTPLENDALVYVESSDRPGKLLAVKKADIRSALEPFAYFRGKELLGETSGLARIKLSQGKKAPVELKKDKGSWRYVAPSHGEADASALLNAISLITVSHTDEKATDFVKDDVPVADLGKYHLDAKSEPLRIEAAREGGETVVALVGVGKKEGEKHFATVESKGKTRDIVKVPATSVEALTKLLDDPGSLRNKSLVKLGDTPDAIDVKNDYGLLEFRKPEGASGWALWREGVASKVAEGEVRFLIDALNKRDQVTAFPDPKRKKELGLDAPRFVAKLWSGSLEKADDGKKPALKKDAVPVAELRFGNPEGGSVAVERVWGKESDIVMVPVLVREQVAKRPLDYFDKSLPPFNPVSAEQDVTKLEVARGGDVVEVEKDKAGAWKFTLPATFKGRNASAGVVRDTLSALNRLTAREIEKEKAEPKELPGYGLERGELRAKVTITKAGKPTTHEFILGKEKSGKGIYGRIAGNPAVYVFDNSVAEELRREMRDLSAFDFDLEKVASVTIKGWKGLLGSVHTLTADKDGRKWTVKAPPGYDLDPEKLEKFLNGISSLKAEKFIPSGKKLKPEEGGFQVQVTLADKKAKVLELNVGDDEGGAYAATSSQLTGDTFTVPKDLFAGAREKPAYFGK